MAAISTPLVSCVLQHLYRNTRDSSVEQFQLDTLELLRRHLSFDAAWWARTSFANGRHRVHCSFPYRMPSDVAQRFNLTDPENLIARRMTQNPARAQCFSPADLRAQPSSWALAMHMGVTQVLCVAQIDASAGVGSFVSLARRHARPRFGVHDRLLLECLGPHLATALDMTLAGQLAALRNPERNRLAAADEVGWVHAAEPGFTELARNEWPGWQGPCLPAPLAQSIAARHPEFRGRCVHANIRWAGEHVFLSLRPSAPADRLTPRERAVARAFAAGQSYREVALALSLSPATVRHHLRSVYTKLNVSDKIAMAACLSPAPA